MDRKPFLSEPIPGSGPGIVKAAEKNPLRVSSFLELVGAVKERFIYGYFKSQFINFVI